MECVLACQIAICDAFAWIGVLPQVGLDGHVSSLVSSGRKSARQPVNECVESKQGLARAVAQ